ncbi:hypothetical protein EVG20_g9215, partial [Dentipellis fragilis]
MYRYTGVLLAGLVLVGAWEYQTSHGRVGSSSDLQHKTAITPALSKYIEDTLLKESIPGLALGVFHAGGETEFGAWGKRTEDGDAMSTDTLFIIASCSKAFVSASIGILMDDYAHGRNVTPLPDNVTTFDWDTKVKDLLPEEWELMDKWADSSASLRDILSHRTGLPRHDWSYGPYDTAEDVVKRMKHLRPAYEFREQFSYNNLFYMLGAHLVSKYTGSYTQFVQDRIFDPLNMTSSTYSPDKAASSGKLTHAWANFGRRIPTWFTEKNAAISNGPGGAISSVEDLEKWVRMLMNGGIDPYTNTTIIPRSAFDAVTSAQVVATGLTWPGVDSVVCYGLGWLRHSYLGHDACLLPIIITPIMLICRVQIISHSGDIPGIATNIAFLPSEGLGIVVLTNIDETSFPTVDLPQRIIRDTFGHATPSAKNSEIPLSPASTPATPFPSDDQY